MRRKIRVNRIGKKPRPKTGLRKKPESVYKSLPKSFCDLVLGGYPTKEVQVGKDKFFWWDSGRNFNMDFKWMKKFKNFNLNPDGKYILLSKILLPNKALCYDSIFTSRGKLIAILRGSRWLKP